MTEETTASPLNVFVVGASSGLGRVVTRLLVAQGMTVTGTASAAEDAHLVRADGALPVYPDLFRGSEIASTLKMAKTDVVVNVAPQGVNAVPFHKPDWGYYRRLLSDGTTALMQAAALAEAKFVVHVSFACLYGNTHGEWADETAAITADSPLMAAAAQAEEAVLHGSTPGCVLRAGFNYGPGNQSLVALRHALISRGSVSAGHNPASWIASGDLAVAIAKAVVQQPAGEIFNVADDQPISAAEFVDAFADRMGVGHPGKGTLPTALRQVMVPADERALLDASFKASTAKAKAQLEWTPQYTTIQAGIDQVLLAWRATEAV